MQTGQLGELWKYIICKPVSYLLEITFKNIKARAIVAPGAVTSTLTAVPSIIYKTILTWWKMFISANQLLKRGLMKIILQLVGKKNEPVHQHDCVRLLIVLMKWIYPEAGEVKFQVRMKLHQYNLKFQIIRLKKTRYKQYRFTNIHYGLLFHQYNGTIYQPLSPWNQEHLLPDLQTSLVSPDHISK